VTNTSHPVEPPTEWHPTWDDSLSTTSKRTGLLDPTEGGIAVSMSGDEKDSVRVTPAESPTRPEGGAANGITPPAPREPSGEQSKEDLPPRSWIYGQLGMSDEHLGAEAASSASAPAKSGMPSIDFDAFRPGDPNESPFPPGSLAGGVEDPEPRKFHGFPKPGTGTGLSGVTESASGPAQIAESAGAPPPAAAESAAPAKTTAPRPADDTGNNPFRVYDERTATGDIALPTHNAPASTAARVEPARPRLESSGLTADDLTADNVLKKRRKPAGKGWRKGLLSATGGVVNLGPSGKELREMEFEDRVRTPITGCHKLAVISLKGGVGKTTTAAALGSMFASLRGDRVIAVDANPDRGTLGDKIVAGQNTHTVRDFVRRSNQLDRYSAVREFTAQAESRLEVLCSESDPLASMAFSESDYRVISDILEKFYNLVLTDCGTGLLHSAMVGVLAKAHQVVIVSSASLDGARSASATLDWLEAHSYKDLARDSVTVITSVRPRADAVHLDEIVSHFAKRTRAVVAVPYDPHLAEGGQIDLSRMSKPAYRAYLELAAEVGDAFPRFATGN
jgi:MinD-like ATPase involved in chromosome partitioning or flagellar assembly